MVEWNSFYGAILIDREFENCKKFIHHEMCKKAYLYFHPSIFSTGIQEYPYYYENIIISFGRTAKYFVDDNNELELFIKEFEDILNNLDFENAQIKVSATYATYGLFWLNKSKLKEGLSTTLQYLADNEITYFESEQFYFGIGEIDLHTGWVEEKYSATKMADFEMKYPGFKYPFQ
jgi:hypothetical protein